MKFELIEYPDKSQIKIDGQDSTTSGKVREAVSKIISSIPEDELMEILLMLLDRFGDIKEIDTDTYLTNFEV